MRDPKRIKLITDVLCRLWSKPENQNLRLGQLLMNIHYNNKFDNDMFYTEDIEWLEMFMEECNKTSKEFQELKNKYNSCIGPLSSNGSVGGICFESYNSQYKNCLNCNMYQKR